MTLPFELYTIKVYDHTGTFVLFLQKWSSLEFHQRINAPWNHQITLEFSYDDRTLLPYDLSNLIGFLKSIVLILLR